MVPPLIRLQVSLTAICMESAAISPGTSAAITALQHQTAHYGRLIHLVEETV